MKIFPQDRSDPIMLLDHAQGQTTLKCILEAIMDLDPNSPVHCALSKDGHTDIHDVAILTDLEIDNLMYDGANSPQQLLTRGSHRKLIASILLSTTAAQLDSLLVTHGT